MRSQARRFTFGLSTLFGIRQRGFFIPYRYADQIAPPGAYKALEAVFRAAEADFARLIASFETYAPSLRAIGNEAPPAPRWEQDWFPRLDGVAAYTLVREARPARIVEVGAGHSTRFLAQAIRDGGIGTDLTAIDPAPRANIAATGATFVRSTVQHAGHGPFATLAAGDMLVIDSSHILIPGTDVDFLLNEVLPSLPRGMLVHIHDIFLPDPYPADWEWRGYNEQLGVAALLQGGGYGLLWSSRYAVTRMPNAVRASVAGSLPLMPGAYEASLWLEKK
jgi:hypothetical protein